MTTLTEYQRDIAIRTLLGEAANQGPAGQAAVAHVLLNRARDTRWPATVDQVALQPKQFSAWNTGPGGNDLVHKYGPDSAPYARAAGVLDAVLAGHMPDPTGGATHFYSPAGMQALVDQGVQDNLTPAWWATETARRETDPVTIGGHRFTGRMQAPGVSPGLSEATAPPQPETDAPAGVLDQLAAWTDDGGLERVQKSLKGPPAPKIAPPPVVLYRPVKRNTTAPYMSLFQLLR